MSRGDQVTRQWRLIRLLEKTRRGYTFEELACELGCSARTVMRDLEQVQWVGFPVTEERDGKQKQRSSSDPIPAGDPEANGRLDSPGQKKRT